MNARKLKQSGKHICGICFRGVGSNSIYCGQCKHWIHHRPCCGIKGQLKPIPDYSCRWCRQKLTPFPVEQPVEYIFEGTHIETVHEFCYIGNVWKHRWLRRRSQGQNQVYSEKFQRTPAPTDQHSNISTS